jgi:hypothetical protein
VLVYGFLLKFTHHVKPHEGTQGCHTGKASLPYQRKELVARKIIKRRDGAGELVTLVDLANSPKAGTAHRTAALTSTISRLSRRPCWILFGLCQKFLFLSCFIFQGMLTRG